MTNTASFFNDRLLILVFQEAWKKGDPGFFRRGTPMHTDKDLVSCFA